MVTATITEWVVPALIWFVLFPALVTGLIGLAIWGAYGERAQNARPRRR